MDVRKILPKAFTSNNIIHALCIDGKVKFVKTFTPNRLDLSSMGCKKRDNGQLNTLMSICLLMLLKRITVTSFFYFITANDIKDSYSLNVRCFCPFPGNFSCQF